MSQGNNPFADLKPVRMALPVYYHECTPHMRRLVREEYERRQKGNCHHCGKSLGGPPSDEVRLRYIDLDLFPPGFLNHPVHLHHSHETGKTIGAIHARCNAFLWQYHKE